MGIGRLGALVGERVQVDGASLLQMFDTPKSNLGPMLLTELYKDPELVPQHCIEVDIVGM